MDEKSYIPFDKFYNPKKEIEHEKKTETEILTEVKEILDSYHGR